jgi:16S rRNA (guanine527-N7)-methyltransferase
MLISEGSVKTRIDTEHFRTLDRYAREFGITLDGHQIQKFYEFTIELLEWNEKVNLTSLVNVEDIIIQHYLDSLMPGKHLGGIKRLMDIGTGAGFPGIPLRILMPEIKLFLVEPRRKRVSFLRSLLTKLSLEDVHIYQGRTDDERFLELYRESMDGIISRASLNVKQFREIGYMVLREGGKMILMKGSIGPGELEKVDMPSEEGGCPREEVVPYLLPGMVKKRNLVIISK